MIELVDVTKVFRDPQGNERVAVDGLALQIHDGETVSLIGTSGCGKTTALKLVNRLVEPTSGRILVGGIDVASWDVVRLRRRIGYVIQSGGLFPHMTVADNVGLPCALEGWNKETIKERTGKLLELVNLAPDEFANRYPHELSGGQRQRVGVARSLALDPPCILMDEPFGALDPITRDQLNEEFIMLKKRVKKTILFVTHSMAEAFKLADRVALMDAGKIVQIGVERDFRENPANAFVQTFLRGHLHDGAPSHA